MKPIPIFIGYDPREAVAYHTCVNSIIRHASKPVAIIPLALNLFEDYTETHTDGSNQFIYSRFLVPHLMSHQGWAIFIDGDMILRDDIVKLWNLQQLDKDFPLPTSLIQLGNDGIKSAVEKVNALKSNQNVKKLPVRISNQIYADELKPFYDELKTFLASKGYDSISYIGCRSTWKCCAKAMFSSTIAWYMSSPFRLIYRRQDSCSIVSFC